MQIQYVCLTQETVELHLGLPINEPSNSNQYLVSFGGLKDFARFPSTINIIGDWEYQEFIGCLELAVDYMEQGAPQLNKAFSSKSKGLDIVTLEFMKKADQLNKVRLKFTFNDQKPMINGAWWKGISSREFAFYVSVDELKRLANIISRFVNDEYDAEVILESAREDWLCPLELSVDKDQVTLKSLISNAKKHMTEKAPGGIQPAWSGLLDSICPYVVSIAECASCQGLFVQDVAWKKVCIGCFYKQKPTAIEPSQLLKNSALDNWLTVPDAALLV